MTKCGPKITIYNAIIYKNVNNVRNHQYWSYNLFHTHTHSHTQPHMCLAFRLEVYANGSKTRREREQPESTANHNTPASLSVPSRSLGKKYTGLKASCRTPSHTLTRVQNLDIVNKDKGTEFRLNRDTR